MTVLNPYVGPRSFETGEALYGRDRELRSLSALLIAERLVLLHSPSGAGKTSLLQAGLLPHLKDENFNVLPVIRVNIEPPRNVSANRYILSTLISLEERFSIAERLPIAELVSLSLETYLTQRTPDGDMLLVFDQFEEALTLAAADREGKQVFFTQLGQALRNKRRWALFAMREDYLGALAPYLRPVPNRMETRFRLDLLGAEAAIQAIQKPAKSSGVDFTTPAAHKLVDDLRRVYVQLPDGTLETQLGPYVEPVQLQVVCYRLWETRNPNKLDIDETDLAGVGDVNQSLAEYYALSVSRVAQVSGATERSLREWFDRKLITPDGIRGQVRMGAETSEGLPNDAVRRLEDAHIIRAEKRAGQTWYELSHDRLIEPVRANNRNWFTANLSVFQQQATLWTQQGRSEGLLLRGKELAAAEKEVKSLPLIPDEIAFLEACRKLKQRDDRDRLRNRVMTFLAIGATLAMIAAGFLWVQAQSAAQANAQLAVENANVAATAQAAQGEAFNAQATAQVNEAAAISAQATSQANAEVAQINEALAQEALATQSAQTEVISKQTREITARSLGVLAQSLANSSQQIALLLSLYGVQETMPDGFVHFEVNRALNAILDSHLLFNFEGGHAGPLYSAALAEDKNLLVTVSPNDPNIILWNLADGKILKEFVPELPRFEKNPPVACWTGVDINAQGTQVVVAGSTPYGQILFYDAASGELLKLIITHLYSDPAAEEGWPYLVRYSPDGALAIVAYTGNHIQLYDTTTFSPIGSLNNDVSARIYEFTVSALAFNPDNTTLAIGYNTGLIEIWDLTKRSLVTAIPEAHQSGADFVPMFGCRGWGQADSGRAGGVMGLSFSADGQRLASSGSDRMVKIWETASGLNVNTFLGLPAGLMQSLSAQMGML